MTRFINPRFHTPHRTAAIALYRALLRAAAPHPSATPLQTLIRHRFRRNAFLQSHSRLRLAFGSGYSLLRALDASDQSQITALLSSPASTALLSKLAHPPPVPVNTFVPIFPARDETLHARPRPYEALRPKVLGTTPRRRVPVLYSAQRFPVLRFDKPQPGNLSMLLTRLERTRRRRWERLYDCEEYAVLGGLEDQWDGIVGVEEGQIASVKGGSWAMAGVEGAREVSGLMREGDRRAKERAAWYVGIVDAERELAEKERTERRRERVSRGWERKRERYRAEGREWVERSGV